MSFKQTRRPKNWDAFATVCQSIGHRLELVNRELVHGHLYRNGNIENPLPVRIKTRWSIEKKCEGQELYIAFPEAGNWYLAPYKALLELADQWGHAKTSSWQNKGQFNKKNLTQPQQEQMKAYRL